MMPKLKTGCESVSLVSSTDRCSGNISFLFIFEGPPAAYSFGIARLPEPKGNMKKMTVRCYQITRAATENALISKPIWYAYASKYYILYKIIQHCMYTHMHFCVSMLLSVLICVPRFPYSSVPSRILNITTHSFFFFKLEDNFTRA